MVHDDSIPQFNLIACLFDSLSTDVFFCKLFFFEHAQCAKVTAKQAKNFIVNSLFLSFASPTCPCVLACSCPPRLIFCLWSQRTQHKIEGLWTDYSLDPSSPFLKYLVCDLVLLSWFEFPPTRMSEEWTWEEWFLCKMKTNQDSINATNSNICDENKKCVTAWSVVVLNNQPGPCVTAKAKNLISYRGYLSFLKVTFREH